MISVHDLYVVLSAVVPLYVAMILAYGSVRWWKFLTPEQCSGINRFVALFAVPLLSFHFIASNNPYHMNTKYIVADVAQKLVVLLVLSIWVWFTRTGSLEWLITIFMLATLPNTLVMGIPLLQSMYGGRTDILMVQFVVLQSIVWYTILLFLYEYRAAKLLVVQQFPDTAARIVAFNVDSDVLSIDGRDAIETEAEEREDGKIVVKVRRSVSSRSDAINYTPRSTPRRSSAGMRSLRPSNLSGMDIYSLHSSVNLTPRESNFTHADFFSMLAGPGKMASPRPSNFTSSDVYSLQSSRGPTPRSSNFNEDASKEANFGHLKTPLHSSPRFPLLPNSLLGRGHTAGAAAAVAPFDSPPLLPAAGSAAATSATTGFKPPAAPPPPSGAADCGPVSSSLALVDTAGAQQISRKIVRSPEEDARELHMFLWSGAASPGSDFSPHQLPDQQGRQQDVQEPKEVHLLVMPSAEPSAAAGPDFSFGTRADLFVEDRLETGESKHESGTGTPATAKNLDTDKPVVLPAASVMFKLIATMACKKLARNPNTYATTLGVVWSLVAFKYHFSLPAIIDNSVTILSDAGLGMAMFSLGLFMALQKRFVVCGPQLAAFSMVVRFLTGPAVMAAASIAVGLRGRELHIAVVQAALPVGIVPFVFAKEYDVHADILSTALIFGIFVALPVTIGYYVVMGT